MNLDARDTAAGVQRHLREGALGRAVRVDGVGVEVALDTRTGLEGRQSHELPGTGNRERSKHERIEQAADGRGRSDSQRQRDDDDQ